MHTRPYLSTPRPRLCAVSAELVSTLSFRNTVTTYEFLLVHWLAATVCLLYPAKALWAPGQQDANHCSLGLRLTQGLLDIPELRLSQGPTQCPFGEQLSESELDQYPTPHTHHTQRHTTPYIHKHTPHTHTHTTHSQTHTNSHTNTHLHTPHSHIQTHNHIHTHSRSSAHISQMQSKALAERC